MFPLPVEALDRQRILLIGVVQADSRHAYFVAGVARWSGAQLRVTYDPALPSVEPMGSAPAWEGLDPSVLPRILLPKAWHRVEPLVRDVAACVVAWLPAPIPSALVVSNAFFGLAGNSETGEVFLMQGDPSVIDLLSERPDLDSAT